jgi:hypothetical protein
LTATVPATKSRSIMHVRLSSSFFTQATTAMSPLVSRRPAYQDDGTDGKNGA